MEKIVDDIFNVGVNDTKIDLFEGQYKVKDGMSYNSYLIIDEKIASEIITVISEATHKQETTNTSRATITSTIFLGSIL